MSAVTHSTPLLSLNRRPSRITPCSTMYSKQPHTHTTGIELTWNYGTEKEEGMVYNTGNADTTGTADGNKIRGGKSVVVFICSQSLSICSRLRCHRGNMKTYLKSLFQHLSQRIFNTFHNAYTKRIRSHRHNCPQRLHGLPAFPLSRCDIPQIAKFRWDEGISIY